MRGKQNYVETLAQYVFDERWSLDRVKTLITISVRDL